MSFKRIAAAQNLKSGTALTRDLVGIGFLLSAKGSRNPNIEDTILAASKEGIAGDFRVLGMLLDWLEQHLDYVNVDRLIRAIHSLDDRKINLFWQAVSQIHGTDQRLKTLRESLPQRQQNIFDLDIDYQLKKYGEDSRFKDTVLKVPANFLRHRPQDTMPPKDLAHIHLFYYYRVMIGPSYRADMWAELELNPKLTAAELARRCYGSFATAWKVLQDKKLVA